MAMAKPVCCGFSVACLRLQRVLWILDEPLTGLDVHGVAMVEQMIRDHVVAGGMAIMTTHQSMALDGLTPKTLSVGG